MDDDESLRHALRFMLETEGWRVADYGLAMDFLRADAPSVPGCVLLDVCMPGLTGIEAQSLMNDRGMTLPIIFLTGHGDVDMAVMALHEGAVDFIQKPVDNEHLLAVIASSAYESMVSSGGLPDCDTVQKRLESLTNRLIAERLSIAVRTVEVHRASMLRKLGVKTSDEVVEMLRNAL